MHLATEIQTALLVHDGELEDVRRLLDALGVASAERCGGIQPSDIARGWNLVIGTPARLIELTSCGGRAEGQTYVSIADGDSRTLRSLLDRAEIRYSVRRPVHPAALKNLFLQALYAGPERRACPRRSVGAPVRFRSGLRLREGLLADLSQSGCQLLASERVSLGKSLTVYLPQQPGMRKTLSLRGSVVKISRDAGEGDEHHRIHMRFGSNSDREAIQLTELVERYAHGPAALPTRIVEQEETDPETWEAPVEIGGEDIPVPAKAESEPERSGRDRRVDVRLAYNARVIALDGDAPCVLGAKDISSGGLRTEKHPTAVAGDELQVAFPLHGASSPLVAKARVIRNQEGAGLALSFEDLPEEARKLLDRSIEFLPLADSSFADEEEPALVIVSEILKR